MAHFWLGLDQPSIGQAILLFRRTFRLTRAQLIDRLSDASGGTIPGPDESVVFRWEKGKPGRGYAYSMTVRHLEDVVVPLLRDASYTEDLERQLYAAAAELAHLAGWMAYDVERHGPARAYLHQALRLAMTARDDAFSAEILA